MANVTGSKQKTFLGTLFVLAKSDQAEKIWHSERSDIANSFKTLEEKNVSDEMLSWFYTLLSNETFDGGLIARHRIFADSNDGRWLFELPKQLLEWLAGLTQEQAAAIAEQCLNFEEPAFDEWKSRDLTNLIMRLSLFAKECRKEHDGALMLMDSTSAAPEVAVNCKVRQLCLHGDDLIDKEQPEQALEKFEAACDLAEKAAEECKLASRAKFSAGNAHFLLRQYDKAIECMEGALMDLDEEENPGFIHNALGRCYFEANNLEDAAEELGEAYLMEGLSGFITQDPKYYKFLLSTTSDLGKRAKFWNDALLCLDLHLKNEFGDDPVAAEIGGLCLQADSLASAGNYPDAINLMWQAFDSLPESDAEEYFSSIWIRAAIGDLNFRNGDFQAGADNLQGIFGHAFSYLRLGQCLFELGEDMEMAVDSLARAYIFAGRDIFEGEDPKYIAFLSTVMKPPAGQSSL